MYTRKYDFLETLRPIVSLDTVTHTVVTLKTDNSFVFFYLLLSSSIFFCRLLSFSVVFFLRPFVRAWHRGAVWSIIRTQVRRGEEQMRDEKSGEERRGEGR